MSYFSTPKAAKLADVTLRQVQYWDTSGLLSPSYAKGEGYGARRGYSFRDVVALRTVARLREVEVPLQRIRRVVDFLKTMKGLDSSADALAASVLIVRGADVIAVEDGAHISALVSPGQFEIGFNVPIGAIVQEVRERIAQAA